MRYSPEATDAERRLVKSIEKRNRDARRGLVIAARGLRDPNQRIINTKLSLLKRVKNRIQHGWHVATPLVTGNVVQSHVARHVYRFPAARKLAANLSHGIIAPPRERRLRVVPSGARNSHSVLAASHLPCQPQDEPRHVRTARRNRSRWRGAGERRRAFRARAANVVLSAAMAQAGVSGQGSHFARNALALSALAGTALSTRSAITARAWASSRSNART